MQIHVKIICSAFKENKHFRPNFCEDFLDNLCFLYISLEKEVYKFAYMSEFIAVLVQQNCPPFTKQPI